MTERAPTPSDYVGERLKQLRQTYGLSAAALAERCRQAGAEHITAAVIANIETGRRGPDGKRRRDVTVDELLTLSYLLGAAPLHVLVPPLPSPLSPATPGGPTRTPDDPNEPNDNAPYPVAPEVTAPCYRVRQFIRGIRPLDGMNAWTFYAEQPPHEQPSHEELQKLAGRRQTEGTEGWADGIR